MSQPYDSNRYRATVIRHIDADTTHADVDWGGDTRSRISLRWAGIDAPERYTDAGKAATAAVNGWLPVGATCEIETTKEKKEKFGRYLASFFIHGDPESLNDRLVRLGLAVPYDGGAR